MVVQLKITTRGAVDNKEKTKSFGNCNTNIGSLIEGFPAGDGSKPYHAYAGWADTVARALLTLSLNTYVDSKVDASWSMSEEQAG